MSSSQPSLWAKYSWARSSGHSPVLFAGGFVPQIYSASLSETMTELDADLVSATKVLADALSMGEVRVMSLLHSLADSISSSETFSKRLTKALSEAGLNVTDSMVASSIKTLSDFILIKEWISIRLAYQTQWVNPVNNANIFDSLWGKFLFGRVPFGGKKPLASWAKGIKRPEAWTNVDGHKYNY